MDKGTAITLFMNTILGQNSPEFFKMVDSISSVASAKKKSILFNEGDTGDFFYFLISGRVKLFKVSYSGKEVIVKIVNSGEIFAEVAIIESRYPVSAVCLDDCNLLKIDAKSFWKYFESNTQLTKKFMVLLLQRVKTLLSRLEFVGTESVEDRLMDYLRDMSKKNGEEFELPISKGELASLLFTTPETLSRTFGKLKDKGLIEITGKTIKVKNFTKN